MKRIVPIVFLMSAMISTAFAQGSLNMNVLSNVSYPEGHNDVWGYVAPDGTEYAVLGTREATVVLSLEDPSAPEQVARFDGANSTWRDMKTWGEFIYVTTDVGTDGLVIIDMSGAPENITANFWKPDFTILGNTNTLEKCHNLYIDENGYIYLAGCNLNGGGLIILDAFTTPGQPQYVGAADPRYSHDVVVRNDVAYSSDIQNGFFSIIDVSDKENPETLVTQATTTDFTHNAWFSDDGNYLFTTDERPNAFMDAYDISDLSDIKLLDSWQPTETVGRGVIPHNAHYYNGYLVTSWYTDGVRIIDGSRPDNLVEVAYYDSWDGADGGFNGCWGAYPYLPSGLVLISDIQTGLYVLGANYQRACYLEGRVTDSENGAMLNDVSVEIVAAQANRSLTNNTGDYKSGLVEAGEYQVSFSKPGYESATGSAVLINGEVTILDIALEPKPRFALSGVTLRDLDDNVIEKGNVFLRNEQFEFSAVTNTDGQFMVEEIWAGTYDVYAGAWGYRNIYFGELTIEESQEITIKLEEGYMDDFIVDLGWTVESDASTGAWERGEPMGTGFGGSQSSPDLDLPNDVGDYCYVTGNGGGSAGNDDIDDGSTILKSPMMDLTSMENPIINFNLWFFNAGGQGSPNDMIEVKISNGVEEVVLQTEDSESTLGVWLERSEFPLFGLLEITETMQLIVETGDLGSGHLVEAAIDVFEVTAGVVNSIGSIDNSIKLSANPNPFGNNLKINFESMENAQLIVLNLFGQQVHKADISNLNSYSWNANVASGVYVLQILNENKMSSSLKVMKR